MLWQLCASAESSRPWSTPNLAGYCWLLLATAGRAPNPLSTSRAAQRGRCPARTALGYDAGGAGFFLASMLEMARRHPPQYGGSAVSTLITSQFSRILALVPCSLGRLFSFVLCSVLSCSAAPLLALTVLRVQSHEASQGPPLSGLLLVVLQPYPDNCPTPPAWVEHWHFPMKARSLSDVRTDKRISAHAKANPRRSFPPSFFILLLLLLLHLLQPPTPTALLLHPSWVPQHKWLPLTSFGIALVQWVNLDTASSLYLTAFLCLAHGLAPPIPDSQ
ncbi:hypothetical protein L207DRAFT_535043 [Hyaloscypha variabilis F]|uniref:Uncharacterized protein n=1 Tax=Hyaloscypha variabilis (strain UAMH 11265 / GT02V1 / F) TaxID=1149755 RepID=A0A2J6R5I9_HYAVF|nr:hypothetical protein L207DRAFT_535043 [Hyaloscypha variabilis F]